MNWKEQIKACIFDLDGVIVDTAKYHFTAWKALANRFDFDFDEVFNETLKGVSRIESLKLILQSANVTLTEKDFNQALIDKNENYLELIKNMDKGEILPGILPYLIVLAKNNIPIALGSASKNAKVILERVELIGFFDIISDGNMVSRSKPDPEVFQICSDFFKLDPANCIVFEDSIKGIEAANTGGFKAVGIGEQSTLDQAGIVYPDLNNAHPSELLSLFN